MQKVTREVYILNGKEYTLEQVDQLRNEFTYLSETIDGLIKDKDRLELSRKLLNEEITQINEDKDKEITRKEQELSQYIDTKEKELLDRELFIKGEELRLSNIIREYDKTKKEIDQETIEIITKKEQLEKQHKEYMKEQYVITKENEEKSKFLSLEKEDIIELNNSTNKVLQENKKTIELYNKEKKQWEKDKELYNKELEQLKQIKEYINTKTIEIENREQSVASKENSLNKIIEIETKLKEENKSYLIEIQSKEMDLMKKTTEFQEEKYKFFIIMKQKGIKKTDLDKLEKDFNT